ncbi:lytic transglycosylase domain-containing protein (plasmid) [Rhizobium sp. CB3060]|uniref:lytic transglycosylase domain-containing protein n=1 Tax=Rhizobium sp. CB3060 TaxID=3138255 RepID=UPI0021A867AF|nr:lytic transglycosylase domain-containing protein [Rhizobium tropici]UWU26037.1 lytic transglycosylase domain-containing protein [Rhizobium tropici]
MNTHLLSLAFIALSVAVTPAVSAENGTVPGVATCIDGAVAPEAIKEMIRQESERQGVDTRLAMAISDQESGFGRNVNSPAGARGPMQLMSATAARYNVVDICDAAQNIRGGIAYLKDLGGLFGGNILLTVAAYNAGEDRIIRSGGVPAIAETVNYTALVANAYYGFDNSLKGGRHRKDAVAPTEASAGVDLLATGSVSGQPIPINRSRTEPAVPTWIGGSVLYVQ